MSNFLKQGLRKSGIKDKIKTKKHINKFYKILHELDLVARKMIESGIIITEDNVVEEASKYTNREIADYEKSILVSKCHQVYEKIKENEKDKS